MNKTNGKSMDKASLVLVKEINMGGSYSICRYPSQGNIEVSDTSSNK